jgi:cytochrome c oxidase cbb3-type subunit 3
MGGATGPDLTRSQLVADDAGGDKIKPVVRNGRPDKGMPPLNLGESDLTAIVAFVHDARTKAGSVVGARRRVDESDLLTGSADAGARYFNGAGECARCHSPSGDLAGVADRFKGLELLQRMLNPAPRGGAQNPARVTVTLPSGETVAGRLAHRDEFTVALRDANNWYRSWPAHAVTIAVDNPLDAHVAQIRKYSDRDMHDVYAYLLTLKGKGKDTKEGRIRRRLLRRKKQKRRPIRPRRTAPGSNRRRCSSPRPIRGRPITATTRAAATARSRRLRPRTSTSSRSPGRSSRASPTRSRRCRSSSTASST